MYEHVAAKDPHESASARSHTLLHTQGMIRFWIIGAFIAYCAYIAFNTLNVIYLILAAFVISMILEAPVTFFRKFMPRGVAIAVSYLLILSLLLLVAVVVLPFVIGQLVDVLKIAITKINAFQELIASQGIQSVVEHNMRIPGSLKKYLLDSMKNETLMATVQANLQANISQIVSMWTSYATNLWSFAVTLVTSIFTTIFQTMIVFLMAIFFSIEKEQVINFIAELAGNRKNHMYVKLQKMYAKLGLRLKGQAIVCLYVGVATLLLFGLSSWIFGISIPNIGTLALLAGLLNLIPYIGPLIWMATASLVTLVAGGWQAALLVLLAYVLVNQSENNILTPIIMNKTLGVSALLIFICMLLWGLIFGFIGVLLAVPIAVILTMAFDKYDKEEE